MSLPSERCSSCDDEIVWMVTNMGKDMPVDAETVVDDERLARVLGLPLFDPRLGHVSHFATCPYADQHRRPKSPKKPP